MKKLFAILFATVVCIAAIAPEKPAEAQVVYSLKCCDANGYVRCYLQNWTPIGNACICYGIPGVGYTC